MRLGRHVLDVNHRPARRAPRRQQIGDALLGVRIVARAEAGVIETFLDVYDEEGRIGWLTHGFLVGKQEKKTMVVCLRDFISLRHYHHVPARDNVAAASYNPTPTNCSAALIRARWW